MIPITLAGKYDESTPPRRSGQRSHAKPAIILAPFAAGYLLSYLFRTANGPMALQLIREFGLGPRDLGTLTALYFLTFAAFQIPAGLLIDRFGPRRVQATLLLVAASGVFLFAGAHSYTMLMLSRALIGLGCSGALVTGVKALALWLPPERRALGNCLLVMCGGMGAIAATAPLEAAVRMLDWRTTFALLGLATLCVAGLVWMLVPEPPKGIALSSASSREVFQGLRTVVGDRRFWRVAPLSASTVGTAFAIHGLWAARWLADVARLAQPEIDAIMLAMGVGLMAGALGFGALASRVRRRGVATTSLFGAASLIFLTVQATVILAHGVPAMLVFGAFSLFSAITVLSFTILGELFPAELAGRANGALNVLHLGAAFALQAAIGAIVALWPADAGGHAPAEAYETAFLAVMAIQAAGLAWLARPIGSRGAARLELVWANGAVPTVETSLNSSLRQAGRGQSVT